MSAANENNEENMNFVRGSAQRSSVLKRQRPTKLEEQQQYDKKLPFFTGASSFKELLNGKFIVDKSLFIEDVINCSSKNIRFCLPKGFGKTINLRMAESFFDMPEDGPKNEPTDFPNYKLFEKTEIFKKNHLVSRHFGKHPVIYMTLANVRGETKQITMGHFRKSLSKTCEKFRYIYLSLKGSDDALDIGDFNFLKGAYEKNLTEDDLHSSLHELSGIVKRWHEKKGHGVSKAIILLDEYDKPINNLHHIDDEDERKAISKFHADFLNDTFKQNDEVFLALAAGVFRTGLPDESRLQFETCNLVKGGPDIQHFGFTDKDVADIAKENEININENHLKSAKLWYNGYCCGLMQNNLYNPSSFACFLNDYIKTSNAIADGGSNQSINIANILECYFTEDAKLKDLKKLLTQPEVAEQLNMLLFGESKATYHENAPSTRMRSLQNSLSQLGFGIPAARGKTTTSHRITFATLTKNFCLEHYNELAVIDKGSDTLKKYPNFVPLFFSYLFHMGYLTVRDNELCVPNEEIRIYMKQLMIPYYVKVYAFRQEDGNAVTDALRELVDVDGFSREDEDFQKAFINLKKKLDKFFEVVSVDSIKNEFFPHAMLTYLLARIHALKDPVYDENKTTADGEELRMDLSFHLNKTTVIVEMKAGGSGEQSAETAFTEARYYRKLFEGRTDIDRFIFIGISVTKNRLKEVRIAYDIVNGRVAPPKTYLTPRKIAKNKSHSPKIALQDRTFEKPDEVECARIPIPK